MQALPTVLGLYWRGILGWWVSLGALGVAHPALSSAEALQTHSALFLPKMDVAAPPTPTGSFGGFWKGSELAEPPTPASTSEVVKSKCHPRPPHPMWAP